MVVEAFAEAVVVVVVGYQTVCKRSGDGEEVGGGKRRRDEW